MLGKDEKAVSFGLVAGVVAGLAGWAGWAANCSLDGPGLAVLLYNSVGEQPH